MTRPSHSSASHMSTFSTSENRYIPTPSLAISLC